MRTWWMMALLFGGCARDLVISTAAADESPPPARAAPVAPRPRLKPVAADGLCVTRGALERDDGMLAVREPVVRAVAASGDGDAAALRFVYRGATAEVSTLASGQERHQLGLKLRAQDGCNLVYVMWRISPKPGIEVSIKRNPDAHTHAECGANGYTKVKAEHAVAVPELVPDAAHTLRAAIVGDRLTAWIDDHQVWTGPLDPGARDLHGPAGLRTDNVAALVELAVPPGDGAGGCPAGADSPD
jgi:hypothetical protein